MEEERSSLFIHLSPRLNQYGPHAVRSRKCMHVHGEHAWQESGVDRECAVVALHAGESVVKQNVLKPLR